MAITIVLDFSKQNELDQSAYFTLTDNDSNVYRYATDIPKEVDAETHIEAHKEDYLLEIRKIEYPGCPDFSTLAEIEQWILDGHRVNGTVIEKVDFVDTHIWHKYNQFKDIIDTATVVDDLKLVLRKMLKGEFLIAGKVLDT